MCMRLTSKCQPNRRWHQKAEIRQHTEGLDWDAPPQEMYYPEREKADAQSDCTGRRDYGD